MTFATRADIDAGQLMLAQKRLREVIDIVGEGEAGDLNQAAWDLRRSILFCDDGEGTYEDNLTDAIRLATDAVDDVESFLEDLRSMYQAGRVRASNDTVLYVTQRLHLVLGDIAEWADGARRDLRNLD